MEENKKDYKPLISLISKIAIYVGLIVLIISAICLIVVSSKDYTKDKEYKYEQTIFGMEFEVDIVLKDNGTFIETAIIPGDPVEVLTGKYFVKSGNLYLDYDYDNGTYEDVGFELYGEIDATEIEIEMEGLSVEMVCKSAKTQENLSITFTIIGSILFAAGLIGKAVVRYLENKTKEQE